MLAGRVETVRPCLLQDRYCDQGEDFVAGSRHEAGSRLKSLCQCTATRAEQQANLLAAFTRPAAAFAHSGCVAARATAARCRPCGRSAESTAPAAPVVAGFSRSLSVCSKQQDRLPTLKRVPVYLTRSTLRYTGSLLLPPDDPAAASPRELPEYERLMPPMGIHSPSRPVTTVDTFCTRAMVRP